MGCIKKEFMSEVAYLVNKPEKAAQRVRFQTDGDKRIKRPTLTSSPTEALFGGHILTIALEII